MTDAFPDYLPVPRDAAGRFQKDFPRKHGHAVKGRVSRTYKAWIHMRERCLHAGTKQYKDYGGRGIAICERWNAFANFLQDMGEAPPSLTLDRINNDGNYEPANCRWATRKEQALNTRRTIKVEYDGEIVSRNEARIRARRARQMGDGS